MPYANNRAVRIYYEVEGQGPPLVLAHPGNADLNSWRKRGYVEALKRDFELVLIDMRGHGKSDKPHDPSDYWPGWADDVVFILSRLGIGPAHYWGYSLGARVGFWLAAHHSTLFRSFILGGTTPYDHPEVGAKRTADTRERFKLLVDDPETGMAQWEKATKRPMSPQEKEAPLSADAKAIIAMITASLDSPALSNEDLASIDLPCVIYCGELDEMGFHDSARESVKHLRRARFVSLPDLNHMATFARSDLVLPHVKKFLAEVSKT